ncbi:MAG TPA: tetratricopeptide repeat protein [Nodularia sp. (in: cyanobacteria)]|nr:tetratricopeptide repeat protein [Nodularia sp. (in: cyanobacteria)]
MSLEEVIFDTAANLAVDLAEECVLNDFTGKNKVGALAGGVGALYAIGALGLAGPIAIPIAIAGGVLVGATGESSIKSTARSISSIVESVASGLGSVVSYASKGITGGVLGFIDIFKSDEDFLNRGLEKLENKKYKEASEDFSKVIEINPQYAEAYFLRGCIYSDK